MAKRAVGPERVQPERIRIESERTNFRALISTNPNYFGNLQGTEFKPVKKIAANTSYEELTCIGYNLRLSYLEATIQIKRPSGYGGPLCGPGTSEFVRFFVDYGGGWEDAGLAAVNVHDLPTRRDCAGASDHPISYVVTLPYEPRRDGCRNPLLPRVRAILSWVLDPPAGAANAGWIPVWGNVLERSIQIQPRRPLLRDIPQLFELDPKFKLPPEYELVKDFPFPIPDPPPFAIKDIVSLYKGKPAAATVSESTSRRTPDTRRRTELQEVQPSRFATPAVQHLLAGGALNQQAVLSTSLEFKEVGLNLAEILVALEDNKGNVSFEELNCVGLDYNRDLLVGTYIVKRPSGYSGSLCTAGSIEYVAFWADWENTCEWTYLGTAEVPAHDIPTMPPDGLHYSAVLPVDLSPFRRTCREPRIGRVRAVLSWATPPSTTDPDAVPYWGNRIDTHVQIKPGELVGTEARISIIGGIGVEYIEIGGTGLTKPNARFALWDTPADPWGLSRPCPFGGSIHIQAPPIAGHKYKLWAQNVTQGGPEIQLTQPVWVTDQNGFSSNHAPGPGGLFDYLPVTQNLGSMLYNRWVPGGDDLWRIRLELFTAGGVLVGSTGWHNVQVDNTAPSTVLVPPTIDIRIDSGGDCKDFTVGTNITGRFVARDIYFGEYRLNVLPTSMSPNATTPVSGTTQTAVSPGNAWSLNTTGMQPCGYVVQVQVWDRSIVNSHPASHNYNRDDVGLCLRK